MILWTVAGQAPLSMAFSIQGYWSGLPRLPPGDLPDPGTEPTSAVASALQESSLPLSHQGIPLRDHGIILMAGICIYWYSSLQHQSVFIGTIII